jgi:putative SOS response-associated peptidase YedK
LPSEAWRRLAALPEQVDTFKPAAVEKDVGRYNVAPTQQKTITRAERPVERDDRL